MGSVPSDRKEPSDSEILLDLGNLPSNFVDGYHPDDGIFDERPITPEYIIFEGFERMRLFLRISVRVVLNNKICYFPLTFLIDTGAIEGIHLSPRARGFFEGTNRIKRNNDEAEWVVIDYGVENSRRFRAFVLETPPVHQPANIIGLKVLRKLGFHLSDTEWHFDEPIPYL